MGPAVDSIGVLLQGPSVLLAMLITVLPAKSDSVVMFCLQRYQGLRIDISLVY